MLCRDGCFCLVEIKDAPRIANIPIVMYSNSYERNVADMLFEMGADYFIQKPTDFEQLRKLIERALCFVSQNAHYSPTRNNFLILR